MSQTERLVHLMLVSVLLVNNVYCLPPIKSPFNESLDTAMFPNERISLDDCHLRYYRYGDGGEAAPAFASPVYLKEFAHMAAIGWTLPNDTISWKCGGSLIWENYVLTAAHCTLDNGQPPDVARFGDINIFSDEDDQFAQQLKIVQVIRHPDYKFSLSYNDIALLRLEKNVRLHETVSPACLWIDSEVRFSALEATGWGDTGYAQDRTPSLLKVTLKPTTNKKCSEFYDSSIRILRDGLKETQLCAGDELMDTCPGDSGGPLQIKLLHNGKVSPFLVGVTSFGTACGTATPGVYTKVSSYYQWILQTMQSQESDVFDWSLEPISCALRYAHLREYEEDAIIGEYNGVHTVIATQAHVRKAGNDLQHKITVAWKDGRRENCSATLIADDTALTLAECTSHDGIAPSHVIVDPYGENFDIAMIIVHPEYRKKSLYNNIAVLKLKDRVQFSRQVTPACIWNSREIPNPQVEVASIGRKDINEFYFSRTKFEAFEPTEQTLLPRLSVNTPQNCTIPEEFLSRLTRGLAPEHLCVGYRLFLVPGSCRLLYGAPIQRQIYRNSRFFTYAYGLNAFGRDCGFGEAAVATRLSSHVDWLRTVLLPNTYDRQSAVQFINPEWKEDEDCDFDYDDELPGICTHYTKCSKVWNDFKANRRVGFCSTAQVICCPRKFVENKFSQEREDELDTCRTDYQQFHPKMYSLYSAKGFAHTVSLICDSQTVRCLASLITKRTAVTSASCALLMPNPPTLAILANNDSVAIEQVVAHPDYNNNDKSNDIALIKLIDEITPTASVFPACVWTNLSHTPLYLRLIVAGNIKELFKQVTPMYNTDCQRDYKSRLTTDQLCVQDILLRANNTCYNEGDQLVWTSVDDPAIVNSPVAPHVVGFYSYGELCEQANPAVFTRIASYVDWIRENI
ncbi:uncharacterized protein LOC128740611 [Sabethes cyaneus]|uniref:uncharacterized protein LOC128740611 n=1 Tax=Sabethes cyaneus TaxID=53552 RepID=UPI00237E5AD3|nr:uncharacterized protein LOC128740611 [Sabethes cyaneus]